MRGSEFAHVVFCGAHVALVVDEDADAKGEGESDAVKLEVGTDDCEGFWLGVIVSDVLGLAVVVVEGVADAVDVELAFGDTDTDAVDVGVVLIERVADEVVDEDVVGIGVGVDVAELE